jgi:hypothetical protein
LAWLLTPSTVPTGTGRHFAALTAAAADMPPKGMGSLHYSYSLFLSFLYLIFGELNQLEPSCLNPLVGKHNTAGSSPTKAPAAEQSAQHAALQLHVHPPG